MACAKKWRRSSKLLSQTAKTSLPDRVGKAPGGGGFRQKRQTPVNTVANSGGLLLAEIKTPVFTP
ncbi:hypothetical protein RS3R6_15530 [Pseudomonas atacamensis]|uniref:Uncharacterized protein n=1 Tax=Pseudomonas atacamensis TaxID=2565368 RepID=A0ABQ5PKB6_9PSED|nr:hypothetical protein RS3R1_30570 [Pseudomonas atacamensis]GLH53372.1 hypothetical protein RS3R6_15530 [Pseudomonas atacamensis]